ncbi:hypothetical protein [Caulobacter segnis]|uniref:hypothetical protein n=1 Tax=Caulobacter segnis TaxID=88688 RepID=UPI002859F259|nr:hypothetical protein [Caulobacter segnis]MDR6624341.1 hypothetical protein [Caulobacter segnis]
MSANLKSLGDYGTLDPTGVTDVKALFDAATADTTVDRVYIPEGIHYNSGSIDNLRKGFWGPGKIRLGNGTVLPADFAFMATAPAQYPQAYTTPWPPNATPWFGGDNKFTRPQCVIIGQNVRRGLDERYFEGSTIPRNGWMETGAGWSGASAHLSAAASAGATSVQLNSAVGFSVGDVIGFSTLGGVGGGTASNIVDRVTLTGVSGNTISFTPALTTAYAVGATVTHGTRTQHVFDHIMVETTGGGDSYGSTVRMRHKYQPLPGQTHVFEGATASQYGGSIIYYGDGQFGTGFETQFKCQGGDFDVGNIGMVQSFLRNNDTGARSATWLGTLFKSEGTKPGDACHVVSGRWRVGLDTVKADFSGDGQAAIQLKTAQRIYLNASENSTSGRGSDATGNYPVLYGNVAGDSYITHSVDGTGPMVEMYCGPTYRMRLRANGTLNFNGNINAGGALQATTDISVGATGILGWAGSSTMIFKSGSTLRYSEDGGATSVPLAGGGATTLARGSIFGLILSNNSSAPNTHLNIAAGQARDSSDVYDLRLTTGLTKRLDQTFAAGTGNGGRDTSAAIVANTSYHVFLIRKTSDGALDVLFSTSALSPTLPTGYAAFRRLGAVMTDASGFIKKFVQHNDYFELATRTADFAGVGNGSGPYLRQISVPRGVPVKARIFMQSNGGTQAVSFSGVYDPALGVPQLTTLKRAQIRRGIYKNASNSDETYAVWDGDVWTDSNAQVYTHSDNASDTLALGVYGWTDERGQYL